ncbi:hypothetical protein AB0395_06530 [Streptosporangium sp. NPDC051023]|uniref:hypothetical protein n=1 Tax=Streptosporangium sp. NPDC051023 TaxID=3155410 RepID=UPI00344E4E3B
MNDRPGRDEDRLVYKNTGDTDSVGNEVNVPSQRADEVTPEFQEPRPEDALAGRQDGPHGEWPGHPGDRHDGLGDALSASPPGRDPLNPAYQVDPAHQPDPGDPANPVPTEAGQAERQGPAHPASVSPPVAGPLFEQDAEEVRRRWQEVQASFVDDPRDAVERADSLVTEITDSLRAALEARASGLQGRWKNTGGNDTEDLRTALRDYRALLEQLLDLSTGLSTGKR